MLRLPNSSTNGTWKVQSFHNPKIRARETQSEVLLRPSLRLHRSSGYVSKHDCVDRARCETCHIWDRALQLS